MAKRFIDSKTWEDPWFQEVAPISKLFWIYLFTKCDMVGLWEYNPKRAEFDIGKKINWELIQKDLKSKVLFTEKYWILKNFIKQQYPQLNIKPDAPLHKAVFSEIEKKGINFDLDSLSIDYQYPIDSLQVIVKEKDKVLSSFKGADNWKQSFDEYQKQETSAYNDLIRDTEWISERKKYHKNLDVMLSLEKAHIDFWNTEEGWMHKKKKSVNKINWKKTFQNALTMKSNHVYLGKVSVGQNQKSKPLYLKELD